MRHATETSGQIDGRGPANSDASDSHAGVGFSLWFGMFGGAIAWVLHLLLAYGIAEFGCVSRFHEVDWLGWSGVAWLVILASAITAGMAIAATLAAYRNRDVMLGVPESEARQADHPRLFLAQSGILASGVFVFVILVESLPIVFYLRDC